VAKYLIKGTYTPPIGVQGLLEKGGSDRVEAVSKLCQSLGGKLEAFYFAFGETDAYAIVELPDNASAASLSLVVGAAGEATTTVVALLTPQELDQASKLNPSYRPPGN
jgi:uncharacterized protein with GYD domain